MSDGNIAYFKRHSPSSIEHQAGLDQFVRSAFEFLADFSAVQSHTGTFIFHVELVPSNEKVVSMYLISAPHWGHRRRSLDCAAANSKSFLICCFSSERFCGCVECCEAFSVARPVGYRFMILTTLPFKLAGAYGLRVRQHTPKHCSGEKDSPPGHRKFDVRKSLGPSPKATPVPSMRTFSERSIVEFSNSYRVD